MDILANAKQHFRDKVNGELLFIDVPEWGEGDEPARIYYKAAMTLKQKDKIFKLMQQDTLESMAESLIVRALDAEGIPLFKPRNKTEIMNMFDSAVINDVMVAMNEDEVIEGESPVEEAAKNS